MNNKILELGKLSFRQKIRKSKLVHSKRKLKQCKHETIIDAKREIYPGKRNSLIEFLFTTDS
jgi:hypothetical protein